MNIFKNESSYKRIDLKQIKTDRLKDTIKGQVLTEFEEPIPGADIFIKELNLKIETDSEGNFTIAIPEDLKDDSITILIKYPWFEDLETHIYKNDLLPKMNFYLKEEKSEALAGIVATTYVKIKWWQFWERW